MGDGDVSLRSALAENERVAGFVYVGTAKEKPAERERPELTDIVAAWTP